MNVALTIFAVVCIVLGVLGSLTLIFFRARVRTQLFPGAAAHDQVGDSRRRRRGRALHRWRSDACRVAPPALGKCRRHPSGRDRLLRHRLFRRPQCMAINMTSLAFFLLFLPPIALVCFIVVGLRLIGDWRKSWGCCGTFC